MLKIDSKASLKRIPVGTKLALVNSLMGPCEPKPRTVKTVRSNDLIMATEKGDSYLGLSTGDKCVPTERGFRICNREGRICAEYIFLDEAP